MSKQPISVTLQRDNITWLKGRADAAGCKSVSELLDRLITAARMGGRIAPPRSVIGTVEIDPADPALEQADAALQKLYEQSMKGAHYTRKTLRQRKRAKSVRRD